MKPKIFCDLDGVLADFVGGAARLHGLCLDPYPCPGEWDFVAHLGLDAKEFWSPMGYDFWANLDPTPEFGALKGLLEGLDAEVYLLSSPCETDGCCDGKRAWVRRHWPAMSRRLYLVNDKTGAAGPGRVLVDDADHNCDGWREHGGVPLLFPRKWNTSCRLADDPVRAINWSLYSITEGQELFGDVPT